MTCCMQMCSNTEDTSDERLYAKAIRITRGDGNKRVAECMLSIQGPPVVCCSFVRGSLRSVPAAFHLELQKGVRERHKEMWRL